jgi:hypothetical protein
MENYRAYVLGIDGHRFIRAKDFPNTHLDDSIAISAAKKLVLEHEVELWESGRLVARLSPEGLVSSPNLAPIFDVSNATKQTENTLPSSLSATTEDTASTSLGANHLLLGW